MAAFIYLDALQYGLQIIAQRSAPALAVTISFALIAWGLRSVSKSGALAGAAVTYVVFLAMGMAGFLAVLTVFLLTYISTRFGYAQKERLGSAQEDGRSGSQVLANLGAAAMTCAPVMFFPYARSVLFVGACAALAEAAADTVSSEIGQAFRTRAYLITNLKPVPVGQNGGVSVTGSICGILAVLAVGFVCVWMEIIPIESFPIVTAAGSLGMFVDSVLGATLESPDRLGNNSVNFISTVFAAFLGTLIAYLVNQA